MPVEGGEGENYCFYKRSKVFIFYIICSEKLSVVMLDTRVYFVPEIESSLFTYFKDGFR
jgi:hypothetical protein